MKEEINMVSFDKERLNKLKDIFESYQIKSIDIDKKMKSDSKFIIEYHDKPPMILNKKFKFKIKQIRNKYYRQLLNFLDFKEDVDKEVDKYNSNIEKYLNGNYEKVITNIVNRFINNNQKQYFKIRNNFARALKSNAAKEIAEIIYDENK